MDSQPGEPMVTANNCPQRVQASLSLLGPHPPCSEAQLTTPEVAVIPDSGGGDRRRNRASGGGVPATQEISAGPP